MEKLSQVLAVEKDVKGRAYSEMTKLHHLAEKPALFNGFTKEYSRKSEDGETFPSEDQKVQLTVTTVLRVLSMKLAEFFDVTAQKDFANCIARADVVVDGGYKILTQVPATYLLFLEKQLNDLRTFISKLPTLDRSKDWVFDENSGEYKTAPVQTHKTRKVQKPLVLYPATPEHPAQTQLITEDEVVGYWGTIYHSGAIPPPKKEAILDRVNTLSKAVKKAREEANSAESTPVDVGKEILEYLFNVD